MSDIDIQIRAHTGELLRHISLGGGDGLSKYLAEDIAAGLLEQYADTHDVAIAHVELRACVVCGHHFEAGIHKQDDWFCCVACHEFHASLDPYGDREVG